MATYIIRRLIQAIPIMLGISFLIFMIVQLAPGEPIDRFRTPNIRPEQLENLMRLYGLDKPLLEQYLSWLTAFFSFPWNPLAWGYSFIWKGTDDTRVFEQALQRLLEGQPIGSALESFHLKFAEISADLMAEKIRIDTGKAPNESLLASLWTAAQDARNYVILGDPAARLPAAAATG